MVAPREQIDSVIATFAAATTANLMTPTRAGNCIELSAEVADELLITADLHGNRRNFQAIRRLAALDTHPRRHLVLQEVCHGGPTYPAGGCMSHGLLEEVAKLKVAYPDRVHFLLSNHELAELIDFPILKNKQMLNLLFRNGLQQLYGSAAEQVRAAAQQFIGSCPLAVRLPGGVFISHSLPEKSDTRAFDRTVLERDLEPQDLMEGGAAFRLVWGRDYRAENARAFARTVGAEVLVHGHEPCAEGSRVPNEWQVILDCCGEQARCLLLPVGPVLSHAEIVARIQPLYAPRDEA
jgi:hypothetical protein